MIRRFALLSVALHLSVAIALVHSGLSRLAAPPSAELQATLVTSQAIVPARTASASRRNHQSPVDASPLVTDTASRARIATAPAGAVQAAAGPNNGQDDAGNQAIVNHLLSELRTALDAGFIYPPIARHHGWEGQVQLGLTVDADGRLSDLCVLSSSGYSVLDKDAIRTVARIGILSRAAEVLAGRSIRLQLPVFYRLIEG